jgi:hypothetical protein
VPTLLAIAAIGLSQNMTATHNCTPSITKFSAFFS